MRAQHPLARRQCDRGQMTMMVALMMGIFLMAFVGFATDYTNYWFQRQAVQGAADATCQTAAVDMYLAADNFTTSGNFTAGATAVSCASASPYPAPCTVAKYNGFDGTKSNVTVSMSFLQTLSGYTGSPALSYPFVKVDITKQAAAYFSTLLTRQPTVNVHASATCGVLANLGAGQVLMLRPYPQRTDLTLAANSTLKIAGGSTVGLQVNADSSSGQASPAINLGSGSVLNLSLGGLNGTGSNVGVTGVQNDPGTSAYLRGTTGQWVSPDLPVLNPFQGVTIPTKPSTTCTTTNSCTTNNVAQGTDGCPDPNKCVEYGPGYWNGGLTVGTTQYQTAIFKPGLYYFDGNLTVNNGATIRNAILTTGHNATDGVFFYFNTGYPVISAGTPTHNGLSTMASTYLTCNGNAPPSFGTFSIPSSLTGNVLISQCTTDGTYVTTAGNTSGTIRGLLFMINPEQAVSLSPSLTGSSGTVSAYVGNQYLHTCSSTSATTGCNEYTAAFTVTGAANDGVITWGNIVADTMTISGAYETPMLLNGNGTSNTNPIALLK